ncbi:hypothetical protein MAR_017641 [Mya arenaria]|uniref:Uncharacterized protein n=1 Tax=Mya arenaria TaxID=6604 RepID=A0ABY7ECE7_MYAAR|nr:hypothetical protein MAR_017641 [Mya arenaria]
MSLKAYDLYTLMQTRIRLTGESTDWYKNRLVEVQTGRSTDWYQYRQTVWNTASPTCSAPCPSRVELGLHVGTLSMQFKGAFIRATVVTNNNNGGLHAKV